MKNLYRFMAVLAATGCLQLHAQLPPGPLPLSSADSLKLISLPEWPFDPSSRRISLPAVVDNSATPYMRPLIAQVGLECGQASSIGIMFTYEINAKRKVPGNLPENQYATHFTYNFLNNGSNAGISYYESFEVVKYAGNPSVATYGGMASGGPSRWMDGYGNYLAAMKNRIENVYSIKTNTLEGLQKVKHWIYDHGAGSENGGMVSFYSQFTNPPNVFPAGVPEAGKHVITWWGSNPDHAMTIVGYNDSIRWDYNGDGQYTNHIDLNGDGIIDVRDWEIGGFKMANTYGSISGWGDQGFSYMMYKTVADATGNGGIWNNQVVLAEVKENYIPAITAKVGLTYPCRNKLKIMAGVSLDPMATAPEYSLNYPMFDFQGGCHPMQGNGASSTIEIGLDLTPLLRYVPTGTQAKYYLTVIEDDPGNGHSGTINYFSLIDYTGQTPVETAYPQTNIPIQNNTFTHLPLAATINYPEVTIDTSAIPPVNLYVPQQIQLLAEGGQAPYYWYKLYDVAVQHDQQLFSMTGGTPLQVNGNVSGYAELDLPFEFPFYGGRYQKIYPTVDGFIMFEPSLLPWPYYFAGRSYLIQNKIIAPALSKPFQITAGTDGIWAEVFEDYAIVRWRLSVYGQSGNGQVQMAARLHSDGRVEFFYGNFDVASFVGRFAGISAGDGVNYQLIHGPGFFTPIPQQHTLFVPHLQNHHIKISKQGQLEIMLEDYTDSLSVRVLVSDQNGISDVKTLSLFPTGMVINYDLMAGDDQQIDFGETVTLNIGLTNANPFPVNGGQLSLQLEDPFVSTSSGGIALPPVAPGESVSLPSAFVFDVSMQVPDQHRFLATLSCVTFDGTWTRPVWLTAFAPNFVIPSIQVDDGQNGILEPGETATLIVNLQNAGHAPLNNVAFQLLTQDQYLNIIEGAFFAEQVQPGQTLPLAFTVNLSAETPQQHMIEFLLQLQSDMGYQRQLSFPLMTSVAVENFESGGFGSFAWEMAGQAPWTISTQQPWEGNYCARSGAIPHSAFSELKLNYNVAYADSITFYYKVSSENNYDYLKFYIGAVQKAQWSGEKPWTRATFPVASGINTFRWRYEKDNSVVAGSDCAWLDYIVLPVRTVFTSIDEPQQLSLKIYPNPAGQYLHVEFEGEPNTGWHFMLLDAGGRLIRQWHSWQGAAQKFSFSLDGLASGNYHLIYSNGKAAYTRTIVKF
ncbi:MAG: T9SS type A sorting domain-containing protein [Bacteroidetes bacterium]|nr:T9SS type A sorting domain-containing protein [Bacteroidota bacterium]